MLRYGSVRGLHQNAILWKKIRSVETPSEKTLSSQEIDNINKLFLSRTNGLEPDIEIKELPEIKREFQSRNFARYIEPSRKWYKYDWIDPNKPTVFTGSMINDQSSLGLHLKQDKTFKPSDLQAKTLDVGDMVLLSDQTTQLAMCVALPESTSDPRYSFVSIRGELKFKPKHNVLLRIPYELPSYASRLIKRESSHGYTPIGTVKNTKEETFILPLITKQMLTSPSPSRITTEAWQKLPIVVKKLKLLHRFLQNAQGPIQYPFFQLCQFVDKLDLEQIVSQRDNIAYINAIISNTKYDEVNNATFLATYWAIQEQQEFNMWGKIHTSSALLTPISVTVLPLVTQHYYYSELIKNLRLHDNKEMHIFASLVNNKDYAKINADYKHLLYLFRDYAAGNFHNNDEVIALIAKMFRMMDAYKDEDISKDICYHLLRKINPEEFNTNPFHYNQDLNLPISSILAQNKKMLYDITPEPKSLESTPRKDFGDLRVFCIDSEDAHEIDDGVSIKKLSNDTYRLFIHVADPASFFQESQDASITDTIEDDILQTAFEKSFTSYLPDNVEPMLPKSYSKAADLGHNGEKSKTITFNIDVKLGAGSGLIILHDTFEVSLGLVSNFPKATYDDVDAILKGTKKVESPICEDLQNLHQIANRLRNGRIYNNDAIIFGEGFNKGQVKLIGNSPPKVTFYDQLETPSTVLVSELMILANILCGKYFKENNIPGVFRCYSHLKMGHDATTEYINIRKNIKKGLFPSLTDTTRMSSLLNSSFYTSDPMNHAMVGAPQYLTVTSPLRRFPDMINHLQLHRHLADKNFLFSKEKLNSMVWNIQSRADILKKTARYVNQYWTLEYISMITKQNPNKRFDVMVRSVPFNGNVNCILNDYSYSTGFLKLKKGEKYPQIGDTIKNCKISKIMKIDGVLELEAQ